MSTGVDHLASILAALAETPARLAALERSLERAAEATKADLAVIRAALPPTLVTLSEAAQAFKVSPKTMRRWVKSGEVPTVKIGSTVRVDMSRLHGVDARDVTRMARDATRDHNPLAVINGRQ